MESLKKMRSALNRRGRCARTGHLWPFSERFLQEIAAFLRNGRLFQSIPKKQGERSCRRAINGCFAIDQSAAGKMAMHAASASDLYSESPRLQRARKFLNTLLLTLAMALLACTAGVAHTITVVLPTPHLTPSGKARQFGTLYFFTDRNMPETSHAFSALMQGETAQALEELAKIEGANLPAIQRAYWQNDVAVCFILEGRYKEADELLLQAGLTADEEAIRHNHRVSVYLNDSHTLYQSQQRPLVVPENPASAVKPTGETLPDGKKSQ